MSSRAEALKSECENSIKVNRLIEIESMTDDLMVLVNKCILNLKLELTSSDNDIWYLIGVNDVEDNKPIISSESSNSAAEKALLDAIDQYELKELKGLKLLFKSMEMSRFTSEQLNDIFGCKCEDEVEAHDDREYDIRDFLGSEGT